MSKHQPTSPYAELDWRPWEVESLDSERHPSPSRSSEPEPTVDMAAILAEIAELKKLAQQQGHAEGYQAGFDQGLKEGTAQGKTEGFKAGHAQAVEQGYNEGYQSGNLKVTQQSEQLAQLISTSSLALESLHEEVGQALLQLAIRIAEYVLQTELKQHPEQVAELLTHILKESEHKEQTLTVLTNPADCALINEYLSEDLAHNPSWRIKADPMITQGGVLVTTALGEINATLENRWRRVLARLGPIEITPKS